MGFIWTLEWGAHNMPLQIRRTLPGFLGLEKFFWAFLLPYNPCFCIGDSCLVAPPRYNRLAASAISGLREQNIKTAPTLHLMPVDEQHIMIDCLF